MVVGLDLIFEVRGLSRVRPPEVGCGGWICRMLHTPEIYWIDLT
jgi:hypothetical protein